uniref:Uncharacterized protein n=1 Tax=Panagrolaimus sp. ES5 TaxID=591445 RepID=A0AC34FHW1_9BILA
MLIRYHKAPNNFQQLLILQDFSSVFVLLPIFWERMIYLKKLLLNEGIPVPPLFPFRHILTFSSKKYEVSNDLKWKIDLDTWIECEFGKKWNDFLNEPEKLLNFPHRLLYHALMVYKEQSVVPVDEKVILEANKSEELYKQFMRDDLSFDEWILYLNEIKDDEVIFGLFEHRLGGKYGCLDKNIWKYYINFLKEKEQHLEFLNAYRRYTRFFIEDKETVEEYRNEIERISKTKIPVAEFWIDTILYEM